MQVNALDRPQPEGVQIDPLGRLDTRNAAKMLGRTPGTVSNWRVQGIGPKHFVVGGRCFYWADEVMAYGRGDTAGPV